MNRLLAFFFAARVKARRNRLTDQDFLAAALQKLLQAGQAVQARLVLQAHLEQNAGSTDALLLNAMACLQSGPTSLAVGTASALEGVQFAR